MDEIATLLKGALGIFLMGFGAMNLCRFALVWVDEKNAAAAAAPVVGEDSAMDEAPVVEETEQAE